MIEIVSIRFKNRGKSYSFAPNGMEIATRIYTRHKVLTDFFTKIGVPEDIAREDACKVEHDLSPETFQAIRDLHEKN